MPESSGKPPERPKPLSDAPLQEGHRVEPTADQSEDVFDLADDGAAAQPAAPGPKPSGAEGTRSEPEWYYAKPGGAREGPFALAEMQRRVASGQLRPGDLVWCQGMADWMPAREVGVLQGTGPGGPAPVPPLSGQVPPPGVRSPGARAASVLEGLDRFFSRPAVYRIIGRVCAVLGVLVALVSTALLFFGWHWYTSALVFGLIFVVCEAAGAILEALERQSGGPGADKPGE